MSLYDNWTDQMLADGLRDAERAAKRNTSSRGAQYAREQRSDLRREIDRRAQVHVCQEPS